MNPQPPPNQPTQDLNPLRPEDRDIESYDMEWIPRWTALFVPVLAVVAAAGGGAHSSLSGGVALLCSSRCPPAPDQLTPFFHQSSCRAAGRGHRPLPAPTSGLVLPL